MVRGDFIITSSEYIFRKKGTFYSALAILYVEVRCLRAYLVQSQRLIIFTVFTRRTKTKRQWCSGNMEPFQGSAGGSIPPWRNLFPIMTTLYPFSRLWASSYSFATSAHSLISYFSFLISFLCRKYCICSCVSVLGIWDPKNFFQISWSRVRFHNYLLWDTSETGWQASSETVCAIPICEVKQCFHDWWYGDSRFTIEGCMSTIS